MWIMMRFYSSSKKARTGGRAFQEKSTPTMQARTADLKGQE
jgi:hypothetical protein